MKAVIKETFTYEMNIVPTNDEEAVKKLFQEMRMSGTTHTIMVDDKVEVKFVEE